MEIQTQTLAHNKRTVWVCWYQRGWTEESASATVKSNYIKSRPKVSPISYYISARHELLYLITDYKIPEEACDKRSAHFEHDPFVNKLFLKKRCAWNVMGNHTSIEQHL